MNTELNQTQVEALKKAGCTCSSCWWREGDRCYAEPCEREENGRSKKEAIELCNQYENKRKVLGQFLPDALLTILSEEAAKNNGKTPPNY